MTRTNRNWARQLLLIVASLALFATACGGGASSAESSAAVAAGEANQANLLLTRDLATTHLLNTADGEITSLSEVVTGDRPILVWYWAPH